MCFVKRGFMRPKKPESEKQRPVTVYLRPDILRKMEEQAKLDRRSISMTGTFMIEHALSCPTYIKGHVPADQIKFLRGQGNRAQSKKKT